MATRYFTYRYSGQRQQIGKYSGQVYFFKAGLVTAVDNEQDADWFLNMGSPENGVYPYRETDASGNPIGPFPPIDFSRRQAMINPKLFPSDVGVPEAHEWRRITETLGDPTLYYHHVRKRIR